MASRAIDKRLAQLEQRQGRRGQRLLVVRADDADPVLYHSFGDGPDYTRAELDALEGATVLIVEYGLTPAEAQP